MLTTYQKLFPTISTITTRWPLPKPSREKPDFICQKSILTSKMWFMWKNISVSARHHLYSSDVSFGQQLLLIAQELANVSFLRKLIMSERISVMSVRMCLPPGWTHAADSAGNLNRSDFVVFCFEGVWFVSKLIHLVSSLVSYIAKRNANIFYINMKASLKE